MDIMKNYEYEEDLDILYINNNFGKENVVGNLVFGNIVIDIGQTGKVLGIEVEEFANHEIKYYYKFYCVNGWLKGKVIFQNINTSDLYLKVA